MGLRVGEFRTLVEQAEGIRQQYRALNAAQGKRAWEIRDYAMGFVGDVGDLQKLIMAKENLRNTNDVDAKLAHELSDCPGRSWWLRGTTTSTLSRRSRPPWMSSPNTSTASSESERSRGEKAGACLRRPGLPALDPGGSGKRAPHRGHPPHTTGNRAWPTWSRSYVR